MKYRTLGNLFDRIFRNNLNANFSDIDKDIKGQKKRVDDLIRENPQPSEVVDARGGAPVLRDRLDGLDTQMAQTETVLSHKAKHIKEFGAVGDGVTDDTQAIKNAFSSPFDIFSNVGEVYVITDNVQTDGTKNIDLRGKIIYRGTKDKPVVTIGRYFNGVSSNVIDNKSFRISVEVDSPHLINLVSVGYNLVELINMRYCDVWVSVNGGHKGIVCVGDRQGYFANNIYLGSVGNALNALVLDSKDGGYVNGNVFYKGSFFNSPNHSNPQSTKTISIITSDGQGEINSNNLFIKPTFGGRGAQPIYVENGYYNTFNDIRAENGTSLSSYVHSATDTDYTMIDVNYPLDTGKPVEFGWTGRNVVVSPNEKFTKLPFIELYNWRYSPSEFILYRASQGGTAYRTRIKGLDTILTSANTTTPVPHSTTLANMPLTPNGMYIGAGRAGVWIDTRSCKYIFVRMDINDFNGVTSGSLQPTFRPFDQNGNLIENSLIDLTGILRKPSYNSSNREYDPSTRILTFGVKLSENVKTLFVGVRSTDAEKGRLQGLKIYGTESAHVYTRRRFGLDVPNFDIHGCLDVGDYVPNFDMTPYTDSNGTYIIKGYIVSGVDVVNNYKLTTYPDKVYI